MDGAVHDGRAASHDGDPAAPCCFFVVSATSQTVTAAVFVR